MRAILLPILSLCLVVLTSPLQAALPAQQATPSVAAVIQAPLPGQVLQGDILITGTAAAADFVVYEVYFGYANDPTGTWFFIQRSTLPVTDGMLTNWDTSTITDGDYALRLVVFHRDNSVSTVIISGLRVRNYTPIETDTPTPQPPTDTPGPGTPIPPSATPSATLPPTLTPLPPTLTPLPTNPAVLSNTDIASTLGIGAGIALGLLALLGIYLGIRHRQRSIHQ